MIFRTITFHFFLAVLFSLVATSQVTSEERKLTQRELFYSPPPAISGSAPATSTPAQVKVRPQSSRPWEVRYLVLQRRSDGKYQGIDVYRTAFHSGDQVRIRVEANQETFLSILQHGSSGKWNPLFPSPKINNGQDRVPGFRATEIPPPPDHGFIFDDQAGQEDIYLIFTQSHIDLRPLIASLNQRHVDEVTKNGIEAAALKQSDVFGEITQNTTGMGSRDLVYEQAEEDTSDGLKEIAFYAQHAASLRHSRPSVIRLGLMHVDGKAR